MTIAYLLTLPNPDEIPPGKILVHNQVKPTRKVGNRGFRIWLSPKAERAELIACRCGWAPELGPHYRVKAIDEKAKAARKRR